MFVNNFTFITFCSSFAPGARYRGAFGVMSTSTCNLVNRSLLLIYAIRIAHVNLHSDLYNIKCNLRARFDDISDHDTCGDATPLLNGT